MRLLALGWRSVRAASFGPRYLHEYTKDHEDFRGSVAEFVRREVLPNINTWETNQRLPRALYAKVCAMALRGCPHGYPKKRDACRGGLRGGR
jgi:hypothetical protein